MEHPESCCPEKLKKIKERIEHLRQRLESPPEFPTEVYSRITGYYRPLKNWNPGKTEEYHSRKTYTLNGGRPQPLDSQRSQYILVTAQKCPWCDRVKKALEQTPELQSQVNVLDVESPEGESLARAFTLTAVPSLIVNQSRVISGGPNVLEFLKGFSP